MVGLDNVGVARPKRMTRYNTEASLLRARQHQMRRAVPPKTHQASRDGGGGAGQGGSGGNHSIPTSPKPGRNSSAAARHNSLGRSGAASRVQRRHTYTPVIEGHATFL